MGPKKGVLPEAIFEPIQTLSTSSAWGLDFLGFGRCFGLVRMRFLERFSNMPYVRHVIPRCIGCFLKEKRAPRRVGSTLELLRLVRLNVA